MSGVRFATTSPWLLLRAPPALRTEVARRAFSATSRQKFLIAALGTGIEVSRSERSVCSRRHRRTEDFHAIIITRIGHAHIAKRYQSATTTTAPPVPTSVVSSTSSTSSNDQSSKNTSTSQDSPPRPSRTRRFIFATTLLVVFTIGGFAMAAAPAADAINGWVNPPSDAETLSLVHPETQQAQEINTRITSHPLAVKLRADASMIEARPHMKIPPAMRAHNLTAGILLSGPEGLEVPPLYFTEKDAALPTLTQISYFGPALCGHPGIVHGGLLATILDEGLARCCFPALPNKVGVTASLKIDYRVPCPAGRLVVLKAHTTKVEGRKAWVRGWIELLDDESGEGEGTKIVEAEALFIEPRQAKSMAKAYSAT